VVISPVAVAPERLARTEWHRATFDDAAVLDAVIRPGDCVLHLVSSTVPGSSNEDPYGDIASNVLPTLRLLELARQRSVKKVVFLSSGGTVYGPGVAVPTPEAAATDPICSYGIQKLAIEKYLALYRRLHGLDSVVLRVANPYGPYQLGFGQGVIAAIFRKALQAEPITIWGDGTVVRDYIHVSDVVEAILCAVRLDSPTAPRLYNIGSGVGKSLRDILDAVRRLRDGDLTVINTPGRLTDVPASILDIRQATAHLGWGNRISWDQGLEQTYHWMADYLSALPPPG
jgi:UDP-glucose 4-epimerase